MSLPNVSYREHSAGIDDPVLVFEARTHLALLDFDFFRLAWTVWHGGEPDDRDVEPGFMTFLFQQRAPSYVRHFARRVLADQARGRLDLVALGIGEKVIPVLPLPDLRDEFTATSLAIALGLLLVIAV